MLDRVKKIIKRKDVKHKVNTIQAKKPKEGEQETASVTFDVELHEYMGGKKRENTKKGVAKKIVRYAIDNPSAENIGLKAKDSPRMLARQVASWKIARALNIRVLATEKYALHKNDEGKDELIGVSALVPGVSTGTAQSLGKEMAYNLSELQDLAKLQGQGFSPLEMEEYFKKNIFTGAIQKQLSDLQLIDALTGQTDRHHGNIFIDVQNQKIYGIDNDQAFVNDANRNELHARNALVSFLIPSNKKKELEYTQTQIDAKTAEEVLRMTSNDLKKLLKNDPGRKYGEYLTDDEIKAAGKRLEAIKRQIIKLKTAGKLITNWGDNTFMESVSANGGVMPYYESGKLQFSGALKQGYQNYIAREIAMAFGAQENGIIQRYDLGMSDQEIIQKYGDGKMQRYKEGVGSIYITLMTHDKVLDGIMAQTTEEIAEWAKEEAKRAAEKTAREEEQKAILELTKMRLRRGLNRS